MYGTSSVSLKFMFGIQKHLPAMAFPPPKSHVKTMFHHANPKNNQTSSYQLHTNYTAHDEVEFDFWGQYDDSSSYNHGDGREVSKLEEALPLWGKDPSKNVTFESSFPLLPHNRKQYSNMSTNSPRHTIAEGRRELMDMVRGMPESTYELSLKDLVDKQHVQEEEKRAIKEPSIALNSEAQINNQKTVEMRNISRSGPISRSGSMGRETFMIKMYVPASLSWKAKANTGIGARISRTPVYVSEKHDVDKGWWIKRIFLSGAGSRSNIGSNSSVDRLENTTLFHGCYPFFCNRKSKGKRIRANIC